MTLELQYWAIRRVRYLGRNLRNRNRQKTVAEIYLYGIGVDRQAERLLEHAVLVLGEKGAVALFHVFNAQLVAHSYPAMLHRDIDCLRVSSGQLHAALMVVGGRRSVRLRSKQIGILLSHHLHRLVDIWPQSCSVRSISRRFLSAGVSGRCQRARRRGGRVADISMISVNRWGRPCDQTARPDAAEDLDTCRSHRRGSRGSPDRRLPSRVR